MKDLTYRVLRHWEDNVVRVLKKSPIIRSSDKCAYCERYAGNWDCKGCPIKKDTGQSYCWGTPYESTSRADLESVWEEFLYLLNVAYSQGLEEPYMEEL